MNEQNYNLNDINIQNAQIKKKAEDSQNPKKVFSIKKGGADYPINEINLGRYGADTRLEFSLLNIFLTKTKIL